MKEKYILYSKDNYSYTIIKDYETLQKWLIDGSLSKGDIVYVIEREFEVISTLSLKDKKD